MKLTIHGYSTALFATWYFIEELGILFDAGDGFTSQLLGKCGKIRHAFISHADRDHITGLLQFNQLFAGNKPSIYYPKDASSFRFMEDFFGKFDPHNKGTQWQAIEDKSIINIKPNLVVEAFENEHINVPTMLKSLSYRIVEKKKKLKEDFKGLASNEIVQLKQEKGELFLFENIENRLLAFSGDTPVMDYEYYNNSKIVIHEATFLTNEETNTKANKNSHSSLEEVLKMVSEIKVEKVILGHFSSRYDQEEIDKKIKELIQYYGIKIPVYRIPVGKTVKNILKN